MNDMWLSGEAIEEFKQIYKEVFERRFQVRIL